MKSYVNTEHRARILEVGCGPGHLTLEFSRIGYDITGIDLSEECIKTAQHFANDDPWKKQKKRGPLNYLAADFMATEELSPGSFDAVIFVGALHHFQDQDEVGARVARLLNENGVIIAHEPTRDLVTKGLAEFVHLSRLLLSVGGGFYKSVEGPQTDREREEAVDKIYHSLKYETDSNENVQSPHDNQAGYAEMKKMLSARFDTLMEEKTYAFFHEMIGGLRYDEETNIRLARYLRETDSSLVGKGVLPGTEFFFVGRKK